MSVLSFLLHPCRSLAGVGPVELTSTILIDTAGVDLLRFGLKVLRARRLFNPSCRRRLYCALFRRRARKAEWIWWCLHKVGSSVSSSRSRFVLCGAGAMGTVVAIGICSSAGVVPDGCSKEVGFRHDRGQHVVDEGSWLQSCVGGDCDTNEQNPEHGVSLVGGASVCARGGE